MTATELKRRMASALMHHAAHIMPPARAGWSAAMENELQDIEDDGVALRWALGCAVAGYRERANTIQQGWYFRSGLALLIAFLALREFFAPLLIFAYRMNYLGLAHFLGLRTAGDDYRRVIPVLEATPAWLPVLWVAAGLLFLVALWRMLRRSEASAVPFFLAFALDVVGIWEVHAIQAATGIVVTPNPLMRSAGVALTLATGLVLWRMTRKKPGKLTEHG